MAGVSNVRTVTPTVWLPQGTIHWRAITPRLLPHLEKKGIWLNGNSHVISIGHFVCKVPHRGLIKLGERLYLAPRAFKS